MNQLGSAAISDAEFADRMERCDYPGAAFHHADHVRLAWHYLRVHGGNAATDRIRHTILRYAASLGHPGKYHDTATIAWMRLVEAALRCTPHLADFPAFLAGHPWLLNRDALLPFYSRELLDGAEARTRWVEPDLHPLP